MIDTQLYRLGPLTLQLVASDQAQQQQVAAAWRHLFRIVPGAAPVFPGTRLRLHLVTTALPTASALTTRPVVSAQGAIEVWPEVSGLYCCCGATHFQIDAVQPHAVGYVAADFWDYALVVQRSFWQTLFFLLVRRARCTFLHANALYPAAWGADAGVLLVGDCGSGKTSLTLSLITAGWRYITDDTVLLQLNEPVNSIQAHAVRRGFACTEQTLAQWPWLAALVADGMALNRQKTLVDPDPLYPASFAPACAPRVLCFPHISRMAQSQVRPLTRTQSFTALLGQPHNGLLSEPTFTGALFTLFRGLVEQTESYRLDLGWDVFSEPAQVSALLLALLPTSALEATIL